MKKLLILSKYGNMGPSSRYRYYMYIPLLEKEGWEIRVAPLLNDNYISFLYGKTKLPFFEIISSYIQRCIILFKKNQYNIIWVEQEAFPWTPSFFEKFLLKSNSKTKIVADYDDAFFHRYDQHKNILVRKLLGNKIDNVMKHANLVLAGNEYLGNRAKKNNPNNVHIFPTVVNTEKFVPLEIKKTKGFNIGWIGSPATSRYLLSIEEALKSVSVDSEVSISFVGAGNIKFSTFTFNSIIWSEESELEEINKFDVGIMPLLDSPWEKGKCGFKLIQYMACGIPVIGSPVGVNNIIIKHGENGFKAKTNKDWIKYLNIMKKDQNLRKEMGKIGRQFILENYSLKKNSEKLIKILKSV